jgi:hypothetical protein
LEDRAVRERERAGGNKLNAVEVVRSVELLYSPTIAARSIPERLTAHEKKSSEQNRLDPYVHSRSLPLLGEPPASMLRPDSPPPNFSSRSKLLGTALNLPLFDLDQAKEQSNDSQQV